MGSIASIARFLKSEVQNFIIQTVESRYGATNVAKMVGPSGDDSPPLENDRVLIVKVDGTGKYASCGVLTVSQGAKPGEKVLYGRNEDGEKVAFLKLLNDGSVVVEGEGDVSIASAGNMAMGCDGDMTIDGASIKINGGSMGAARNGDSVQVEIPAGAVLIAAQAGVPNPTPISLVGKITQGSGSVKVGD